MNNDMLAAKTSLMFAITLQKEVSDVNLESVQSSLYDALKSICRVLSSNTDSKYDNSSPKDYFITVQRTQNILSESDLDFLVRISDTLCNDRVGITCDRNYMAYRTSIGMISSKFLKVVSKLDKYLKEHDS